MNAKTKKLGLGERAIRGCMSTETASISLQIINISRFSYFLIEDTISAQFQEKIEKGGNITNTVICIKCFVAALHTTDVTTAYLVINEITTC